MREIGILLGGRNYRVACEDGQEHRIQDLARIIDGHMQALLSNARTVDHARLLVMAALLVADEVADLREAATFWHDREMTAAGTINRVAERLETIADRLDQV